MECAPSDIGLISGAGAPHVGKHFSVIYKA